MRTHPPQGRPWNQSHGSDATRSVRGRRPGSTARIATVCSTKRRLAGLSFRKRVADDGGRLLADVLRIGVEQGGDSSAFFVLATSSCNVTREDALTFVLPSTFYLCPTFKIFLQHSSSILPTYPLDIPRARFRPPSPPQGAARPSSPRGGCGPSGCRRPGDVGVWTGGQTDGPKRPRGTSNFSGKTRAFRQTSKDGLDTLDS